MKKFLQSNETKYRLLRTILQGIIGVLIANADLIVSAWSFTPEVKAFIVALVMAILSPIMSELGNTETDEDIYFQDEDNYSQEVEENENKTNEAEL